LGLVAALQMLIKVYKKLASEQEQHTCSNVVVRLGELASLAKDVGQGHEAFSQTNIVLHSDTQGETQVITVRVASSSVVQEPPPAACEPHACADSTVQHPSARHLAVATLILLFLVLLTSSSTHIMLARVLLGMSLLALAAMAARCFWLNDDVGQAVQDVMAAAAEIPLRTRSCDPLLMLDWNSMVPWHVRHEYSRLSTVEEP